MWAETSHSHPHLNPCFSNLPAVLSHLHVHKVNHHQQHTEHIWKAGGRLEQQLVTGKHSKLGIIDKVLFHHYSLYSRLVGIILKLLGH